MLPVAHLLETTPDGTRDIEDAIANSPSPISGVRHVFIERSNGSVTVSIALDDPTREARERVFQRQFELIEEFPGLPFDFNLVSVNGRTAAEIAFDGHLVFSRGDL